MKKYIYSTKFFVLVGIAIAVLGAPQKWGV